MQPRNDQPTFKITSNHQSFLDKQKNVFDQLNDLAKSSSLNQTESCEYIPSNDRDREKNPNVCGSRGRERRDNYFERNMDVDRQHSGDRERNYRTTRDKNVRDDKYPRSETKHFLGQESLFKRPEAPINRCLPRERLPDFRKNPNKWTKYSLEDVKDEHMSDRSNTAAALSFLKELEDRKNADNADEVVGALPEKITFKKSAMVKKIDDSREENSAASYRSSKVVMPEYVVGQKVKKERKNQAKKNLGGSKELKLDHLMDGEEDVE